jgi:hypothetical protein
VNGPCDFLQTNLSLHTQHSGISQGFSQTLQAALVDETLAGAHPKIVTNQLYFLDQCLQVAVTLEALWVDLVGPPQIIHCNLKTRLSLQGSWVVCPHADSFHIGEGAHSSLPAHLCWGPKRFRAAMCCQLCYPPGPPSPSTRLRHCCCFGMISLAVTDIDHAL